MKKLVVFAFTTFLGMSMLYAQDQGNGSSASGDGFTLADVFVSGTISFGSDSDGRFDSNQFNFSPQVGYFIDDNIAIGGRFGYTSNSEEIPSLIDPNATVDDKFTTLDIGAFGRYYMTPESDFSVFGELELGYFTRKREVGQAEVKGDGWFIGLSPGINYFLSYNFAIEASVGLLGYESFKLDQDNADTENAFDIGIDLSDINLGVVYRF